MTPLSRLPLAAPLLVRDGRDVLAIDFEDLVKYHGRYQIGALALAYRIMHVAFAAISPGAPVDRRKLSILSGCAADAVADAIELVTRARTDGRYRVDTSINVPGVQTTPYAGPFFFQFTAPEATVALGVRAGVTGEEHLDILHADHLVRKHTQAPLEGLAGTRLEGFRIGLAEKVMSLPDEELVIRLPTLAATNEGVGQLRSAA